MLGNDVFFGACLLGFLLVNYTPFQMGYTVFHSTLGEVAVTILSQVFRVGGIIGFSDAAYTAFRDNPSPYYPTPIFGPILFPSLLGNMGGFFFQGFDGYLENGMPWLFQQGVSCSTFYHFYAHDVDGMVGISLRGYIRPMAREFMKIMGATEEEVEDDVLFAKIMVGLFMVTMAILRMDWMLGGKFSPFEIVRDMVGGLLFGKKRGKKVEVKPPSKKSKKKKQ